MRPEIIGRIAEAACDRRPVSGHTHTFYRYPARFSPRFAAAAIDCFSKPGDVVLDPYMGGGTTIVEAMIAGRRAIGSDINQLAVFIARAKVSALSDRDARDVGSWAAQIVPAMRCNVAESPADWSPRNMTLPQVRWLRKTLSLLLASVEANLDTEPAQRFARCVLLNVGQWALNGRKRAPSASAFRGRVVKTTLDMLACMSAFRAAIAKAEISIHGPLLRLNDAASIDCDPQIAIIGPADLVVTSPPYPGIHMLYHRWQVDGRKETDAPYWITACNDGAGSSFYNFADRRRNSEDRYFEKAECSFAAIRRAMRPGGILVQMVAFSERERQLQRYIDMMQRAGFEETCGYGKHRIWRDVPSRRWHASSKGNLSSSREVVLLHEAV